MDKDVEAEHQLDMDMILHFAMLRLNYNHDINFNKIILINRAACLFREIEED